MKYAKRTLVLMLTLMPMLAMAQLRDKKEISAQVPFKFMVGNKMIPAGECIIQNAAPDSKTVSIRNWDAATALFSSVFAVETNQTAGNYALIFHKYGNRYFLSGLTLAGSRMIYQLPVTKAEAEMRAQNIPAAEQILLASVK